MENIQIYAQAECKLATDRPRSNSQLLEKHFSWCIVICVPQVIESQCEGDECEERNRIHVCTPQKGQVFGAVCVCVKTS